MPWTLLLHNCDPESQVSSSTSTEALSFPLTGSQWLCMYEGCGRTWVLTVGDKNVHTWSELVTVAPPDASGKDDKSGKKEVKQGKAN